MRLRIVLLTIVLLTTSCTVGPRYRRPTVVVPGSYRGEAPEQGAQSQNTAPQLVPLGEEKWWNIFQDEQLRALIRTALKQNYDLRIAASRILEAQAQLGITRRSISNAECRRWDRRCRYSPVHIISGI